jgi:hypothetical protein
MGRASADVVAIFDREIGAWAERIRIAVPLKYTWDEWPALTLRYVRRKNRKHPSAAHVYVLEYLRMVMRRIGEQNLTPDPRLRAQLIRTMARLEQRVTQLEAGL